MPATAFSLRLTIRLPRFFHSLRFRLMVWYLLILGIVLCVFSAAIYVFEEYTLYEDLDTLLINTIEPLASSYDPMSGQVANMRSGVLVVLQNADGQFTQVYPDASSLALSELRSSLIQVKDWGNGQPWGGNGSSLSFTSPDSQIFYFTIAGSPVFPQLGASWEMYAIQRVTITNEQGQFLAFLYIGIPSSDLPQQLQQLLVTLAVVTPLVLLFSSAGGYWLAGRATRPVQTITRTAQEISATDLHRRLNMNQTDEMGELATTFDGMLDRLEEAFARQQQFTADASHELRTPLSIVMTEVQRVLQRPHTTQDYIQVLSIIHQENQRMTRLVSDLLILARTDQGQTVLRREPVDLSEIVIDAAEGLSHLVEQNNIEICLSGLDELLVLGDRLYLTQLCINLLENAIKYSAGSGKQVEVRLDHEQGQARLQVIDEGPGIEACHLPHLFERFYRVDQSRTHTSAGVPSRSASGSGLGLSIVRWIVDEHNGSIQIHSTLGKGSVFEVYLPCP